MTAGQAHTVTLTAVAVRGGGFNGEQHFQHSCEVHQIGTKHRTIVYGRTREQVIEQLARTFKEAGGDDSWMDDFVVSPTRTVPLGLPPTAVRATRKLDREYHMV